MAAMRVEDLGQMRHLIQISRDIVEMGPADVAVDSEGHRARHRRGTARVVLCASGASGGSV